MEEERKENEKTMKENEGRKKWRKTGRKMKEG